MKSIKTKNLLGQALIRLPIFAKAIEKCDAALKPYKLNIYEILTKKDNTMFDNIVNSFVGIAAIQVMLTNILLFTITSKHSSNNI